MFFKVNTSLNSPGVFEHRVCWPKIDMLLQFCHLNWIFFYENWKLKCFLFWIWSLLMALFFRALARIFCCFCVILKASLIKKHDWIIVKIRHAVLKIWIYVFLPWHNWDISIGGKIPKIDQNSQKVPKMAKKAKNLPNNVFVFFVLAFGVFPSSKHYWGINIGRAIGVGLIE